MATSYKCARCGYTTSVKCNMASHLTRKKPCEPLYSTVDRSVLIDILNPKKETPKNDTRASCVCGKSFSTGWSLRRHVESKGCQATQDKTRVDGGMLALLRAMRQEIKELRMCIAAKPIAPTTKINTTNNTNNTSNSNTFNTSNSNTFNIIINPIGSENIEYIKERPDYDAFMMRCLTDPDAIYEYIKLQNAHPDHPENHNIRRLKEEITDHNDTVEFLDGRTGKYKRMCVSEWLASTHGDAVLKNVFSYISRKIGCARERAQDVYLKERGLTSLDEVSLDEDLPMFSHVDEELKEILTRFHFNFAVPIEKDVGIPWRDDEVDEEHNERMRCYICKRVLSCILHKISPQA